MFSTWLADVVAAKLLTICTVFLFCLEWIHIGISVKYFSVIK